MARALQLASSAGIDCAPNPRVGCVLCNAAGQVIGEGCTQHVGGPHAEVMALRDAAARGHDTRGATAYVTLEPCSHHGRTGPCCDALIAAGISRVVASLQDPNPKIAGQGFGKLRAAGVKVATGTGAAESRELNPGFFSRMERGRPWVRLKIAASIDGQTALQNGVSQWITSEASRLDGHAWRARAGALLTGIGTVLADNPRLDVRLPEITRQPPLIVLDSRLQTPGDAHLFIAGRAVFIYASAANDEKKAQLEARGARVIDMPGSAPGASAMVDLRRMLEDLAKREINDVHVEAGNTLNGALLRAGLVDELLLYLAPKLLGRGRGMADLGPLHALTEAVPLEFHSITSIGPDVRVVARVLR